MSQVMSNNSGDASESRGTGGYAVALHVQNRLCVVVGGGAVGERKARELQAAGAQVRVIAPDITDDLKAEVDAERMEHRALFFHPDDIAGAFLVIAATDNPVVNAEVLNCAAQQGVLANRAGSVEAQNTYAGDFDTMATLRRGELLIGVTTGGAGPAISAQIRKELANRFGPEWELWVRLLGQMRCRAQAEITNATIRAQLLRQLAARDDLRVLLAQGDGASLEKVREEAEQMLTSAVTTQTTQRGIACPAQ